MAKVLALVAIPIITSVFSVAEFGIIETGISIFTVFSLFMGMGYDMALKKDLIIYRQDRTKSHDIIFTMLLFLSIWGAFLVGILSLCSSPLSRLLFASTDYRNVVLFAILSVYFNAFIGFILVICRTGFKIVRFAIISVLKLILEYSSIIYTIMVLKKVSQVILEPCASQIPLMRSFYYWFFVKN